MFSTIRLKIDNFKFVFHCINISNVDFIFFEIDSYSAYFNNDGFSQTELGVKLKEKDVISVIITGLGLNYCVFYTAITSVLDRKDALYSNTMVTFYLILVFRCANL